MAFFEAEEKFSHMSFEEFYFEKTNQRRHELKNVEELEVSFCTISSADLARMAVVQHLVCHHCTIESLKPLLDSPLQKLTLVGCKIQCCDEKGYSFAKLRSLSLESVFLVKGTNQVRFHLEVALPLEELEYEWFVSRSNKDIFSKVTQTVHMHRVPCPEVFETLQAHTLIVPYVYAEDFKEDFQLPACVKRLALSCHLPNVQTVFPHVEILVADCDSVSLQQFPNLKRLYINNENHSFMVDPKPEELKNMELLCFHGSFPFREINCPGLCIRQSSETLSYSCFCESESDTHTED